jgi:hypothetical protein
MLLQVPAVLHAATATLGAQANGDIRGGAPDASFSRTSLAVINDDGTTAGAAKAYLRFQLPADFGTATSVTFDISRSDSVSVYDLPYFVYGLNDGTAGETTWTQNDTYSPSGTDLTWNNAPGNNPTTTSGFVNATQVGTFTALGSRNGGSAGDTYAVSGSSLLSFINADTNGYVTLMISQDPTQITSSENQFASDSNPTYSLPALQLTYTPTSGIPTWNSTGSGDWNNSSNWLKRLIPNAVDAEADFLQPGTSSNGGITSHSTVFTDTPVTVGTIKFDNPNTYLIAGTGSLTLAVSTGSASVEVVSPGTHEINLPLTVASNTTFKTDAAGANLIIADPMTINSGITLTTNTSAGGTVSYESTVTLQSGATFTLANSTTAHSLAMAATSAAIISPTSGTKTVLQLDSLSLDPAASLNLANNELIVHNGNLATITSRLSSGYAGGTWSGSGIDSSAAAADPSHLTAVGVMQVISPATVAGQSLQAGDVFTRLTYYGDSNLDGVVDGTDYSRIDNAFLADHTGGVAAASPQPLSGWYNGDFNYDGVIDGSDYTLIDNAFNSQGASISSQVAYATAEIAGGSAVPEPGTLSVLAVGAIATLGRRRRR